MPAKTFGVLGCILTAVSVLIAGTGGVAPTTAPTTTQAAQKTLTIDLGGGATIKMVLIPAGGFTMGSPVSEEGRDLDEVQHEVTISKPFYMGIYEVTQAQWEAVMGNNPSGFKGRDLPVETVSWDDCQQFLGKLNAKVHGGGFRLPTEAEWEYACRAGSRTAYCFGDAPGQLGDHAWHVDNSGQRTNTVGQKKPNAWGLYDMHGNVCEWCADRRGDYPRVPVTDPTGPDKGGARVARGGGWNYPPLGCRAAKRGGRTTDYRWRHSGFRVACSLVGPGPS